MTTPSSPSLPCICGNPQCVIPFGLCHCGCGQPSPIATTTDLRKPFFKGKPTVFIHNHHRKNSRPNLDDAAPFKIDGHYCRLIPLGRNLYAVVWEEDYEWLSVYTWGASWEPKTKSYYAIRTEIINGKHFNIKMHREILGLKRGDKRQGDHIKSGETLDNRRDRLRICSSAQNQYNKRQLPTNSTGFKGVCKRGNSFIATICVEGVLKHLGTRKTARDAHELYKAAALKYFGEFANDGENRVPGRDC